MCLFGHREAFQKIENPLTNTNEAWWRCRKIVIHVGDQNDFPKNFTYMTFMKCMEIFYAKYLYI